MSPSEIAEKLRQKLLAAREAVETGEARLREHYEGEMIEAEFEVKDAADPGSGDNRNHPEGENDGQEEAQREEEGQEVLIRDPRTGVLRKAN